MKFRITGANSESGDDVDVMIDASSQSEVERIAHDRGILVSAIAAQTGSATDNPISLVDDDAPAHAAKAQTSHGTHASPAGNGHGAHPAPAAGHEHKHGTIMLSANSPSDKAHSTDGTGSHEHHQEAAMEYHILMNQALYLLETAVNKYIKEGWEPQGGLTIGMSNNAMNYFQALVRKKKGAPLPPPTMSSDGA
jgi:hypothetical protein